MGSALRLCSVSGCIVCMVHPDIGPESGLSLLLPSCLPLPGNPPRPARQQPACVMRVHAPEHRPSAASSPCRGSICSRAPAVDKKGRRREPPRLLRHPGRLSWRGADPESRLAWDSGHPTFRSFGVVAPKRGMVMTGSFSGLDGGGGNFERR